MAYFERFIARRYLFTREKNALVSAITFIAVTGVAVGVASLIVVLGVMDGAQKELFAKVIALYPHLKITGLGGETLPNVDHVLAEVKRTPGVEFVEPVFNKEALFSAGLGATAELVAGQIIGVESLRDRRFEVMRAVSEKWPEKLGDREVLLGAPLAAKMKVKKGDSILAITGLTSQKTNRRAPSMRLRVAGIFETGYYAFDSLSTIIGNDTARKAFGADQVTDYLHVNLADPASASRMRFDLQMKLGPLYSIRTWEEENGAIIQSIPLQKLGLFIILMLIVLVAGFNIIGTLILMVIEKTREIGILKAIGSSNRMIRRTFLHTGAIIGCLGTIFGLLIGLGICFLLKHVIRFEMPPSVYNFDRLPVLVKPMTVVVIVVSAMLVCVLASFFPALQASRLDPVEALRHE